VKTEEGVVLERAELGVVERAREVGIGIGEKMKREWTWTQHSSARCVEFAEVRSFSCIPSTSSTSCSYITAVASVKSEEWRVVVVAAVIAKSFAVGFPISEASNMLLLRLLLFVF
jgi:hypothetical protein